MAKCTRVEKPEYVLELSRNEINQVMYALAAWSRHLYGDKAPDPNSDTDAVLRVIKDALR